MDDKRSDSPRKGKLHAPWEPGKSGNPGGKPVGARNRLQGSFLNALADDFDQHGKRAIKDCREQNPAAYIKAVASLMPKELEIKRPFDDLTDDELDSAIALLRERLLATRGDGAGASEAQGGSQTH